MTNTATNIILAASASAVIALIVLFLRSLSTRLDKLDTKIDQKFDRLDQKIDALDTKIDQKIGALDTKIRGVDSRLSEMATDVALLAERSSVRDRIAERYPSPEAERTAEPIG